MSPQRAFRSTAPNRPVKIWTVAVLAVLACLQLVYSTAQPSISNPTPQANQLVGGMLEADFQVNSNGGAIYTVPIEVPPGIQGMTPELSLIYDSQQTNGPLGVGWILSGLSAISRTGATRAQDGFAGGVTFGPNDRFSLDGLRLVAVRDADGRVLGNREAQAKAYGQDGTEYRTEREMGYRVTSHGRCGSGPCSFTVVDENGLRLELGSSADSRLEAFAPGRDDVMVWSLRKVTDLFGNFLTVDYVEDREKGFYFPRTIHYSGNDRTGFQAQRRVELTYEPRPDVVTRFIGGMLVRQDRRLKSIETFHQNRRVKAYLLTYQVGAASQRSRLQSIQECGSDHSCLPPTTFSWSNGPAGTAWQARSHDAADPWSEAQRGFFSGDFDGDGRDDVLYPVNDRGRLAFVTRFSLSGDRGNFVRHRFDGDPWLEAGQRGFVTGDFNGDGRLDLLYPFDRVGSLGLRLKISRGDGTWISREHTLPDRWLDTGSHGLYSGDFNADGLADLLMPFNDAGRLGFRVRLAQGDGRWQARDVRFDEPWFDLRLQIGLISGDWNGDGLTDMLYPHARPDGKLGFRIKLARANGSWDSSQVAFSESFLSSGEKGYWPGDFNGDGVTDLAIPFGTTPGSGSSRFGLRLKISRGDGTWLEHETTFQEPWSEVGLKGRFVGDVNGDGVTDLLYPFQQGTQVALRVKISRGDGQWSSQTVGIGRPWVESQRGWMSGDFDGDSLLDLFYAFQRPGGRLGFHQQSSAPRFEPADLLVAISNGYGGRTDIKFRPISDPAVYTRGNSAGDREADVQNSLYVVSSYTFDSGRAGRSTLPGDVHSFSYSLRYGGAKVNLDGRGWLGFHEVSRIDPQLGSEEITRYHLRFPTSGAVQEVELKESSSGRRIEHRTEKQWVSHPFFGVALNRVSEVRSRKFQNGEPAFTTGTDYRYNDSGLPVAIVHHGDLAVPGDDHTYCYRYDRHQVPRVTEVKIRRRNACDNFESWQPALDLRWQRLTYDPSSRALESSAQFLTEGSASTGAWLTESFAYDTYGNRTSETDALGRTWQTTFGPSDPTYPTIQRAPATDNGRRLSTQLTFDAGFGAVTAETDGGAGQFETEFDGFGRPKSMRGPAPDGRLVEIARFRYMADGPNSYQEVRQRRSWTENDPADWFWTREYYDGLGRIYRETTRASEPNGLRAVDFGFDSGNRASFESLPYFPSGTESSAPIGTARTYDLQDRPLMVRRPTGAELRYQYAEGGLRTTISSPDPRLAANQSGSLELTVITDVWGRELSTRRPNGATSTSSYDPLGQQIRTVDAKGVVVETQFDSLGRQIRRSDPHLGTTIQRFDGVGNLVQTVDAEGRRVDFDYDALDRIQRKQVHGANGPSTTTWHYDENGDGGDSENSAGNGGGSSAGGDAESGASAGRVSRISMPGAAYSYTYDAWGRPRDYEVSLDNKVYRFRYRHSPSGLVESLTYPDGSIVRQDHTTEGFLASVQLHSSNLEGPSPQGVQTLATFGDYSALGAVGRTSFGNGVITEFEQDSSGRPAKARTFRPQTQTTFFNHRYQFNLADKLLGLVDGEVAAQSRFYSYDQVGRLVRAEGPFETQTYAYDLEGNPLRINEQAFQYDPDRPHQLVSGAGPRLNWRLTYDRSGHVTSRIRRELSGESKAATSRFQYDGEQRLQSIHTTTTSASTSATTSTSTGAERTESRSSSHFTYDFDGRRLTRRQENSSGATLLTLYVSPELEATRLADGRWIHTRYIGGVDGAVAAITRQGDGSGRALEIDGTGGVLETEARSGFSGGQSLSTSPSRILLPPLLLWLVLLLAGGLRAQASRKRPSGRGPFAPPIRRARKASATIGRPRFGCRGKLGAVVCILLLWMPALSSFAETRGLDPGANGPGVPVEGLIFLHTDHLGSTQLVTDSNGRVTSVGYLPYGELNPAASAGTDDFRPKFSGQELLDDSGLYAFEARLYDPELGRFLAPDPADQYHSPYLYGDGDPIGMVDPDGEFAVGAFVAVAAIATVLAVAYVETSLSQSNFNPAQWDWGSAKTYIAVASGLVDGILVVTTGGAYLAGKSVVKSATLLSNVHRFARGTDVAFMTAEAYDFAKDPSLGAGLSLAFSAAVLSASYRRPQRAASSTADSPSSDLAPLAAGCAFSFTGDTPVLTESGPRPIEELSVGDRVWARHETSGETGLFPITELFTRMVDEVHVLDTQNNQLKVTSEHPLRHADGRWVEAGRLKAGDGLEGLEGRSQLTAVSERPGPQRVFNLEVDDAHTYFAGHAGLWVHNVHAISCRKAKLGRTRAKSAKLQQSELSSSNIVSGPRKRIRPASNIHASAGDYFRPGLWAGPSIPATSAQVSKKQSRMIQRLAQQFGCHTCGSKAVVVFVADHQPVSALNRLNKPQRLYPQCPTCSSKQGGQTAKHLQAGTRPPGY